MNTEQRIQQLEQQVRDLISWKNQSIKQQIKYPLDKVSKDIFQIEQMKFSNFLIPASLATYDSLIEGKIKGRSYFLPMTIL